MVGVALIRREDCLEDHTTYEVCIGVFKTYELAFEAMAKNRREFKEIHDLMFEDATSLTVGDSSSSGMSTLELSYRIIPIQKIEA